MGDASGRYRRSIPRFAQRSGYSFCVLRRVDAGRSAASHDHTNSYSILQRAQLLEGFRPFQRRCFPADETQKQIARVTVNSLVAEIQGTGSWNRSAGKVKSVAFLVEHDFDLVRRVGIAGIFERMRRGDHLQFLISLHFADEPID